MQRLQGELDDLEEEIQFECVHHEGYAREGNGADQGACAREERAGVCAGTAGVCVVMRVSTGAPSPSTVPTQTQKVQVASRTALYGGLQDEQVHPKVVGPAELRTPQFVETCHPSEGHAVRERQRATPGRR